MSALLIVLSVAALGAALVLLARRESVLRRELAAASDRALRDPLTGLPNRKLFRDRLEHALARESRGAEFSALLFCDIDDLKRVNDRLGHDAGDELLIRIAARLLGSVRLGDTVARLGGDEFGVLLEDIHEPSRAVRAAERLLAGLQEPIEVAGRNLAIRASIGIATSVGGRTAGEMLKDADTAMYAAKRKGKNRFELAAARPARRSPLAAPHQGRAEIEALLEDDDALRLDFQPIVDLASGRVVGYEALSRFRDHAERGPAAIFRQAHDCGLSDQLEAKAIGLALAARPAPPGTFLSINVSPSGLDSREVLAALPQDLERIVIEITEHELIGRRDGLLDNVAELRVRGARIAIDDAASGYSGLTRLTRVHPEIIKLDRNLVADVADDPAKVALIESFVRFARRTGAAVCAEGIETLDELRTLADLDTALGQGFALAPPGPPWPAVSEVAVETCRRQLAAALRSPARGEAREGESGWGRLSAALADADSDERVGSAVESMAELLQADEVGLSRLDEIDGERWLVILSKHEWMGSRRWRLADYPQTIRVLESGDAEQVFASDPDADPAEVALLAEGRFRSLLMLPVTARGRTLGLLEVYKIQEDAWSREQIAHARAICHQLGAFLGTARAPRRVLVPAPVHRGQRAGSSSDQTSW